MANTYAINFSSSAAQVVNGNDNYVYLLSNITGSDFWNNVKSDGGDLRLYHDATDTRLPLDIAFIDSGSTSGEFHFHSTHSVSGSSTTYRLEWGDSALTQPDPTGSFGRNSVWSDYNGVWHMQENPTGSIVDSTGNGSDGTSNGTPTSVTGVLGNGIDFDDASNEYIDCTDNSSTDIAWPLTIHANMKLGADDNKNHSFITRRNTAVTVMNYIFRQNTNTNTLQYGYRSSDSYNYTTKAFTPTLNTFYHVAITHRADGTVELYVDGDSLGTTSQTEAGTSGNSVPVYLGSKADGSGENLDGVLDEVRIATGSQPTGYFKEDYNNQFNNSTFWNTGTIQSLTGGDSGGSVSVIDIIGEGGGQKVQDPNRYALNITSNSSLTPYGNNDKYFDLSNITDGEFWNNVSADGGDLRIYHSASNVRLPLDVVYIDSGSTSGELHFYSTASISGSSTEYRLEWGSSTFEQPDPTGSYGRNAVWSDFEFVLHLNGTGSVFEDVSGNGHTGTVTGSVTGTTTDNPFGRYWQDTNAGGYIRVANSSGIVDNQNFGVSAVVHRDGDTQNADTAVVAQRETGESTQYWNLITKEGESENLFFNTSNSGVSVLTAFTTNFSLDTHWFVGRSSGSTLGHFVDGVDNTFTADNSSTVVSTYDITIGNYADFAANKAWEGKIGEVKLRTGSIPDAYYEEEYNIQSNNSTFWSLSSTYNLKVPGEGGKVSKVDVITTGVGSKFISSGSTSKIDIITTADGIKVISDGAQSDIDIITTALGSKNTLSGNESLIDVITTALGSKSVSNGATSKVDIIGTGNGEFKVIKEGGTTSVVDISAEAVGKKIANGSAESLIDIITTGAGNKTSQAGGSTSVVDILGTAEGRKAVSGAAESIIDIIAEGSGTARLGFFGGSESEVTIITEGLGSKSVSDGSTSKISIISSGGGILELSIDLPEASREELLEKARRLKRLSTNHAEETVIAMDIIIGILSNPELLKRDN